MSPITTHVLDTSKGKPAKDLPIRLEKQDQTHHWTEIAKGKTNADGRLPDLMKEGSLTTGTYRITFDTASYFKAEKTHSFYPYVSVVFEIADAKVHYHVPLLLSPFGYSTYRGS